MHRLVRLNRSHISNFPLVPLSVSRGLFGYGQNDITCSLCNKTNSYVRTFWRPQSTNINPNKSHKRSKKRKKRVNKYAELLIVTDKNATQQRASVTRLTSSEVNLLATTNLNLSELYKLKEIWKDSKYVEEHTYNNLTVIENLPTVEGETSGAIKDIFASTESDSNTVISCVIPQNPETSNDFRSTPIRDTEVTNTEIRNNRIDDTEIRNSKISVTEHSDVSSSQELVHEDSMLDLEVVAEHDHLDALINIPSMTAHALQPAEINDALTEKDDEVDDTKDKPVIRKANKQEIKEARKEIEYRSLASFLEICCFINNPHRGLRAVIYHLTHLKGQLDYLPIDRIEIYNILLRGFASKGNFYKVQEVLDLAKSENVELDVHSYAAIFQCLGRINFNYNHLKDMRIYAKDAFYKGITFDKIMNDASFLNDERSFVLKAMRCYEMSYEPKFKLPPLHYKNHLVDGLNHAEQLTPPHQKQFVENGGVFTPEFFKDVMTRQMEMEKASGITIKSIDSIGKPTPEVMKHRETLNQVYQTWEETASKAFHRDLLALSARRLNTVHYEPYMRCIPQKDFVKIIVDEAKKIAQGSEGYCPMVKQLYGELGRSVYARYMVLRKQKTGVIDKISEIHSKYCADYAMSHPQLGVLPNEEEIYNPRQKWQWAEFECQSTGSTLSMNHQDWVPPVFQFVGQFLYQIIMRDLKIDANSINNVKHKNNVPAFYTIFRRQGRISKEQLKPHPILSKLYRAAKPETLHFPPCELPMLCPPVPWTSVNQGGYLIVPCDVVRLSYIASCQKDKLNEAPPEQLYPSLDALNQLASVPWKVNQKLLDVILKVFTSGGDESLDVPQHSSSLPPPPEATKDMDATQRNQLYLQKMQHLRKKSEMYSLWCDCLYRLSLANHFRNDVFWLPHNMDFRGRVYPVPPHLNHLGSDLARSMLIFAESRPLGPKGLDWLKTHLINLTGLKKQDPASERLKFANKNMNLILDSADHPLDGKKWWAKSDEPWQTLACCMEIADAVRSGDPKNFRSHFPVHQDGSCNGLQHYAALGRDKDGAYSVNLTASKKPQDVYTAVVDIVEELRKSDAEQGNEDLITLNEEPMSSSSVKDKTESSFDDSTKEMPMHSDDEQQKTPASGMEISHTSPQMIISPEDQSSPDSIFQNNSNDSVNKHNEQTDNIISEIASNPRKDTSNSKNTVFCYYCESYVLHFPRHLLRNHKNILEVQKISALPALSKQRKDLLYALRKKGNYLISNDVTKPVRKGAEQTEYLPCIHCLGFYSARNLWRHRKQCDANPAKGASSKYSQANAQNFLIRHLRVDPQLKTDVFPRMRADQISLTAKKDKLICAFASRYLKIHREKHFILVASRKMRELARLLIEVRKIKPSITDLFEALRAEHYDVLVSATKVVSRYDPENRYYQAPTLAMNMGTTLKQCCDIALVHALKKSETFPTIQSANVEADLKTLIQLIEGNWKFDVSSQASSDLSLQKWNKVSLVPLASDLKLFKDYLIDKGNNAFLKLQKNNCNEKAYLILLETAYCRLLLLNRRRPGELQRLLIKTYESASMNQNTQAYEEFSEAITETEKILMNNFKRIVIRGKRGRGVPVLISRDVQEHLDIILKCRKDIVQIPNNYLFGNPKSSEPFTGYKVLRKYATLCGAKNPDALTCTRLRKHLATLTQLFSMSENDMEQLASFMGHTLGIHRTSYRLPDDVYQTSRISKLLILMEKGKAGQFKGKSLDEIDLNLEEDLMEQADEDLGEREEIVIEENEISNEHESNKLIEEQRLNSDVKKKTGIQKRLLVPWTEKQKKTVTTYFKTHIKEKRPPKKAECDNLIKKNPELLKNKDWLKIKVFVQNKYRSQLK